MPHGTHNLVLADETALPVNCHADLEETGDYRGRCRIEGSSSP